MNRQRWFQLVVSCCLVGLQTPAWTEPPEQREPPPLPRTTVEEEERPPAEGPFPALSSSDLARLQARLRQEERQRRQQGRVKRAEERLLQQEQARWDQEIKALDQQVVRRQRQQAREARREAQAAHEQRRAAAQEARAAARPSENTPEETPALPAEPPTPSAPSVELAPVVVKTAQEADTAPEPETARGTARVPSPEGAVRINARQMSVSPDRRIAVAQGDVEVFFEEALLTCDRLTLFTDTKDAYAEGRVRLEDGAQVFRGEMVHYNFENKKGRFLQGTVSAPPWHEHGRSVEHVAEGVYEVTPGYLTSCELEPPHFKLQGRKAMVFSQDQAARMHNVALVVDRLPILYLPWVSVTDRRSPFFVIPGKKKPWEEFALMGYRYELDAPGNHEGTIKLDWRRAFGWGVGVDHQFDDERFGKGLFKLYYNDEPNRRAIKESLPKGAQDKRYRVLWRHKWQPLTDTTVVTDIQKFSDIDFRRDLLFREEYTREDIAPDSSISVVTNTPDYAFTGLVRRRFNRFQTVTESLPQLTFDVPDQRIGETQAFSSSRFEFANFHTERAHSDDDTDAIQVDWFQQLKYALSLFRPVEVTPRAGVRQTFYTKDIQGGSERPDGERNFFSGQFSSGVDTSLKLFRIFPVATNALGLNLNLLRHVLTPTVSYSYIHEPTVPRELLNFPASPGPSNQVSFGVENKLQTRRPIAAGGRLQSVDLARFLVSIPYTFQGSGNKQGGRLGDWSFDLETYPWPWLRLESDWTYPLHFVPGTRDARLTTWNVDLVMVGGPGALEARYAPAIQAPALRVFEPGSTDQVALMPQGQWYLGLGHRYAQNDKTEEVIQFDWRLGAKWEVGTFHRITFKEVVGGVKRFNNVREYQYSLRRDLHDWFAELVYHVDREFGEELYLTITLKAYPQLPIGAKEAYHQPKIGSQSGVFSPVGVNAENSL